MSCRYLFVLLILSLAGCVQPFAARTLKPGANYVNNAGNWVEVGSDGKAHQVALPLDQVPMSTSP
jgi:hypothetical protein